MPPQTLTKKERREIVKNATPERHRKITEQDVNDMAHLVAKMLTEKEAASLLGISPQAWYDWKYIDANKAKYSVTLSRVQAAKLQAHLDNIEAASQGKNGHRPDWRASKCVLEFADRKRFGDHDTTTNNVLIATDDAFKRALAMAYGQGAAQIQDAPKALPDANTTIDAQVIEDKPVTDTLPN